MCAKRDFWEGSMNLLIGAVVGAVVALFGVIGGVAAYSGSPDHGVSQGDLYSYSDN
jgi:hypothetical protein